MDITWLIDIPEGRSGKWSVGRFRVTTAGAKLDRLRAMVSNSSMGRYTPAGVYSALKRDGKTIMSTTPDEFRDFIRPLRRVSGDGLIAGLGLGCAVMYAMSLPEVGVVTIVEKSADVLSLVAPTLQQVYGDRIQLVHADIFTWSPPKNQHWDWGWYDIWDDITLDNLPQMTRIKRRFGRRVSQQMCWQERFLRQYNRR